MADGAGADASAEISMGTCDYGDVANLNGAIGNLDLALGKALSAGQLDVATGIVLRKSSLECLLGEVEVRARIGDELHRRGVADPYAISEAQRSVKNNTVFGVIEQSDQRVKPAV